MSLRKTYSLGVQHDQMLTEQAVNLTGRLDRPIACRHVLYAILDLAYQIDSAELAQKVLDIANEPRRTRGSRNKRQ
ncbi:TPA: hypothetical protein PXO57_001611 [Yersinia enterocolitica]|uniref:Uncharacterized protein n=1 Tax=Yersinia intermedia TaxID=631 RepID=A0A0T9MTN8_YERIN|nr:MULTISPECIES: hypothetical protein [Yersinia]EKN5031199.1 hypothetical protein [Yersinia enterocolitica]OVZ88175.1 hypothetical protein CBW58_19720 [Yersinia frederiksenii]CNG45892.1 Uncharacterised protein [Yersinia intermedia]EKN6368055.1 hypothetical protein [Yersinia enterocolitica]ELM3747838.1 hypothetical protein [Yersinia ruckeri]